MVLGISSAESRETRRMCIKEQVDASDAIFVGKVITMTEPSKKTPGVNRYVVVEVHDVLKGTAPKEVNFVVSGYSAELNPACCEKDGTYIFFSRIGYDVFEEYGGSFVTTTLGKDRFLSATNGRFSTFHVQGDTVVGWQTEAACDASASALKPDVLACIHQQVAAQP
ncbi:hypothetical protein [Pseudoxanthomonas wuyuanensis]|nr:hypothetical protein [Pseudoxanthomonas wuyuanensis]KAF1723118.1 hypothetical protein CSC75_01130 [Pseudoxanthomonas wuyuanensis]